MNLNMFNKYTFSTLFLILSNVVVISQNWHLKGNKKSGAGTPPFFSGNSVDISSKGDIYAAGDPDFTFGNNLPGRVSVYQWNLNEWIQMGSDIIGDTLLRNFGTSISLTPNGKTMIVGAPAVGSPNFPTGYFKVFDWNGIDWIQKGGTITYGDWQEAFGARVDINSLGTRVVVSSPFAEPNQGLVKTYDWDGVNWIESANPIFGDANSNQFGDYLDMNETGDKLIVSATTGRYVKIYQYDSSQWVQLGNTISYTSPNNWPPYHMNVGITPSGDQIIIGYSNGWLSEVDFVTNYTLNDTLWVLKGDTIFEPMPDENFGQNVSLSWDGNTIAISAPLSGPILTGHVSLYEWLVDHWAFKSTIYGDLFNEHIGTSIVLDSLAHSIVIAGFGEANDDFGNVQVQTLVNHLFTQNEIACDSFFWDISQNTLYQSNTYYTTSISADLVCDTMWLLDLEIVNINNDIEVFSNLNSTFIELLDADQITSTKWIDCNDSLSTFPQWNDSQFFYPPYSGNFAVVITKNGCVDTSDCDSAYVITTSVPSPELTPKFTITNSKVNLFFNSYNTYGQVEIFDLLGRSIFNTSFKNTPSIDFNLPETQGVYILKYSTSDTNYETIKFIKP